MRHIGFATLFFSSVKDVSCGFGECYSIFIEFLRLLMYIVSLTCRTMLYLCFFLFLFFFSSRYLNLVVDHPFGSTMCPLFPNVNWLLVRVEDSLMSTTFTFLYCEGFDVYTCLGTLISLFTF